MRAFFERHYRDLTSGLLFRPLLMTLVHGFLAAAVIGLDRAWPTPLFEGSVENARAVLTTIASSSFTAISIAFTITIVTLQLVSGQFTPRALRGFLGRPWVQIVAGQFMGLVLYCLVALGLLPDGSGDVTYGLPALVAVILAVCALVALIVFIDRIARAIQVSNIVADLVDDTRDALERHYAADERDDHGPRPEPRDDWPTVVAEEAGVVQSVDLGGLLDACEPGGVRIRLRVQPGDFVVAGEPLARFERGRPDDLERGEKAVRAAIIRQRQRDIDMDPAFGLRQMADIAVRALSPGINDPSTADHCLHWLSALFCPMLAEPRPAHRRWAAGEARVEMPLRTPERLMREALEEIALYSTDNPRMCRGLTRTLDRLRRASHPSHRAALARLAELMPDACDDEPSAALQHSDSH